MGEQFLLLLLLGLVHQAAEGKDSGGKMVVGTHYVAHTEVTITWQAHIQGPVAAFMGGIECEYTMVVLDFQLTHPICQGLTWKRAVFSEYHILNNCMKSELEA